MSVAQIRRFTGGDVLMKQLAVDPPVQLLWWVDGPVEVDLLRAMHQQLARGPLNRRMGDSRIPLARPVWLAHDGCRPLRVADTVLPEDAVLDWADASCRTGLDAHGGRGWELSTAKVTGGTSVVSLVGSHALTDGHGLMAGATLAARRVSPPRISSPGTRPSLAADVMDAVTHGGRTYGRLALARVARTGTLVRRLRGRALTPRTGSSPGVRSRVALTAAAGQIDRACGDGSVTGLALAMTANIVRAARGTLHAGAPFHVGLPVSFRRFDDLESSNMVGMARVRLDPLNGRYTDLADIRRRCKAAYASAHGRHLTGYPQSDAAVSNAGILPVETKNAFGPALAVLLRTVSGDSGPPGRMNCFVLRTDDTVSLGFQSSGVAVSRQLVDDELRAWGITPRLYW